MVSIRMSGAIFYNAMSDVVKLSCLITSAVTTCFDLHFYTFMVSSCVSYSCPWIIRLIRLGRTFARVSQRKPEKQSRTPNNRDRILKKRATGINSTSRRRSRSETRGQRRRYKSKQRTAGITLVLSAPSHIHPVGSRKVSASL